MQTNLFDKKSRTLMILDALQSGDKLSGKDIWKRYGVYRASSVINRLRSKGHNIITKMVPGSNGEKYARYQMNVNEKLKYSEQFFEIDAKQIRESVRESNESIKRTALHLLW